MIHTEIQYLTLGKMFEHLKKAKLMLGHKKKCSYVTPTTEVLGTLYLIQVSSIDKSRAVKNLSIAWRTDKCICDAKLLFQRTP